MQQSDQASNGDDRAIGDDEQSVVKNARELLLSPYTWVALAVVAAGLLGPGYWTGSADALLGSTVGFATFAVADELLGRGVNR